MMPAIHRLPVGLLLVIAGCASEPLPVANQASPGAADQQILVMVKESAVRHYRPGPASPAGYATAASRARSQQVAEVYLGLDHNTMVGIGLARNLWLRGYPAQATERA